MSTSIRIQKALYEAARQKANASGRTISDQVAFWANMGRVALENPDLPIDFIAESLASLSEPREQATDFVPKVTQ
jgi:hypothetical protein